MARIRPRELSLPHNALLESCSVLRRAVWPSSRGVPRATFIGRSHEPRGAGASPATIRSPFVLVHIGASSAFVCHADELSRSRL